MATKTTSFRVPQRAKTKTKLFESGNIVVKSKDLNDDIFKPIEVLIKEKRDRIADEILRSEQAYVRALNLIYTHFKTPLVEMISSDQLAITEQQLQTLFANLEDLINVNTELLLRLKDRMSEWNDKQSIGDVLLTLAPFLRLYTQYSLNYGKAEEVLRTISQDKKIKQFLSEKASDPICNGLDFSAYLIMPIQRIPRYRLLIEEFIANTPNEHPDYKKLVDALDKIKKVALDVDKAIIEQERRDSMLRICKQFLDYKEQELLQPGRSFIYEGELTKVCRKENKKRLFFLFSDILVYVHPIVPPATKYKVEQKFDIAIIRVEASDDSLKFQIRSDKKSFMVVADSEKIKSEWITKIQGVQDDLKKKTKTLQTKRESVNSTAPVWTPDHECKSCVLCGSKWTTFNRRHHCRQCGGVVCQDCSNQKKTIQGQGKVRVCTKCFKKPVDPEVIPEVRDTAISESEEEDENVVVPVICVLEALHDYAVPENSNQKLPFKKGDQISILQMDDSGWWLGELNGVKGWVPEAFLKKLN